LAVGELVSVALSPSLVSATAVAAWLIAVDDPLLAKLSLWIHRLNTRASLASSIPPSVSCRPRSAAAVSYASVESSEISASDEASEEEELQSSGSITPRLATGRRGEKSVLTSYQRSSTAAIASKMSCSGDANSAVCMANL